MTTMDSKWVGDEGPVENINPKDPPPEPMPGLVGYSAKMSLSVAPTVEEPAASEDGAPSGEA